MTTHHPGENLARNIGAQVVELAEHGGRTVDEVADLADIRRTQLRMMINGEAAFNTDHLVKLAIAMGVDVAELIDGTAVGVKPAPALTASREFEDVLWEARHNGWAMQGA
jgi:plasmid maintenance system antidote protein VapI